MPAWARREMRMAISPDGNAPSRTALICFRVGRIDVSTQPRQAPERALVKDGAGEAEEVVGAAIKAAVGAAFELAASVAEQATDGDAAERNEDAHIEAVGDAFTVVGAVHGAGLAHRLGHVKAAELRANHELEHGRAEVEQRAEREVDLGSACRDPGAGLEVEHVDGHLAVEREERIDVEAEEGTQAKSGAIDVGRVSHRYVCADVRH